MLRRVACLRAPSRLAPTSRNYSASAFKVDVSPSKTGALGIKQTPEAASKVTELLQKNMQVRNCIPLSSQPHMALTLTQEHHLFMNVLGFHNHVRTSAIATVIDISVAHVV